MSMQHARALTILTLDKMSFSVGIRMSARNLSAVRRLLVSHARCHMLSPGHPVTRRRHNLYNCCL